MCPIRSGRRNNALAERQHSLPALLMIAACPVPCFTCLFCSEVTPTPTPLPGTDQHLQLPPRRQRSPPSAYFCRREPTATTSRPHFNSTACTGRDQNRVWTFRAEATTVSSLPVPSTPALSSLLQEQPAGFLSPPEAPTGGSRPSQSCAGAPPEEPSLAEPLFRLRGCEGES